MREQNHRGTGSPAALASSIHMVKELYKSMDMEKLYLSYENESYEKIGKMIQGVKSVPHGVFTSFLRKIYKRNK